MFGFYPTINLFQMFNSMPLRTGGNFTTMPPFLFNNTFSFSNMDTFSSKSNNNDGNSGGISPGNINAISQSDKKSYKVSLKSIGNGLKVFACSWSRFGKVQKALLGQVKNMLKAAKELGVTILFGDAERTKAESDAGRAKKGALVCKGGQSPHNYGAAFDIVLYKDGKAVNVDSALQTKFANRLRELSNNQIEWGGEWRKKGERHHFQLRGWRAKYKNAANLVG